MEIVLLEQELKDNYIEAIILIAGGFVINVNCNNNTETTFAALMYRYHEGVLKHSCMNRTQCYEAYKYKHILPIFPSAPLVLSTFVQSTRLTKQHKADEEPRDDNDGSIFGTQ